MHELAETVLKTLNSKTFERIARTTLNDSTAALYGPVKFTSILGDHNDMRTIDIVKVTGNAKSPNNVSQAWSAIAKIIHLEAEQVFDEAGRWVTPENEIRVYELGLFADDGLRFRPAKCFGIESADDGLQAILLEDLSNTPQPPWRLDHCVSAARDLGEFNGYHNLKATQLPIEVPTNSFHIRYANLNWAAQYAEAIAKQDLPIIHRVYQNVPVTVGLEFAQTYDRALELARQLPAYVAFGDSHPRNMFPVDAGTVGIDWAGLSYEPVGCDIGVFIGSGTSFQREERLQTLANEREIFDSYVEGLRSTGWNENLNHVRLAFFTQFAGYILLQGLTPLRMDYSSLSAAQTAWLESRFGVDIEHIRESKVLITETYPKY